MECAFYSDRPPTAACADYLRKIGAWDTHKVDSEGHIWNPGVIFEVGVYTNSTIFVYPASASEEVPQRHGRLPGADVQQVSHSCPPGLAPPRTSRINVNGILIEYEGEDSGIGLLFASKAAVQVGHHCLQRLNGINYFTHNFFRLLSHHNIKIHKCYNNLRIFT